MPPRGGTSSTPTDGGTRAPARQLPEFIDNDLYGSLIVTAIERGRQVLSDEAHRDGRQPSVADTVADQMVTRAAVQLQRYHGLPEADPVQQ